MRTRRESAEKKRIEEEKVKKVEQEKRNKKLHKRRKLIGPYDIPVDRNLPKIYIDPVDLGEPVEVKVEVKTEFVEENEEILMNDITVDSNIANINPADLEEPVEVKVEVKTEVCDDNDEIGPNDLTVDRHHPNIDPADLEEPVEVKVEIKTEFFEENEESRMEHDEGNEALQTNEMFGGKEMEIDDNTLKQVLLMVLPLLDENEIFRYRQVNKQWRRIVDNFIEETVVPKPYNDEAYLEKLKRSPNQLCPVPKFRYLEHTYKFENKTELQKFNDTMKGHMNSKLSPFVGGATVTLTNLFIKSSDLSPVTKQFMNKFGAHIRRLEIHHKDEERRNGFGIVGFVKCVKRCLHYVPNVERLKIKCNSLANYKERLFADSKVKLYKNEVMDRTPKLNKLVSLQFEYFENLKVDYDKVPAFNNQPCENCLPYLEEIFGNIMIKPYYQSQLKQLSLGWINTGLNFQVNNVNELRLANLTCTLSHIVLQIPVKMTLVKCFSSKLDIALLPRLRYLSVDCGSLKSCLMNSKFNNISEVHTLEVLEFNVEKNIFPNLKSAFPHLRHLIIHNQEDKGTNLFKTYWTLSKALMDKFNYTKGVKLKHLVYGGTTYVTNLWKKLPELEVLTFQFRNHVRYNSKLEEMKRCGCDSGKGRGKVCPFKNIVETREGYQIYIGRKITTIEK